MSTPRQVPDELWTELEPLFPAPPSHAKGGRQRANDRTLLDGRLHVLWTGCPWRAFPRAVYGPWQTGYDRFAEWKRAGVFEQIWARGLHLYDGKYGIAWEWQAAAGTFVRAPLGGKRSGTKSDRSRQARL
jgi:transposase